jgi:lysozyme
MPLSIFPTSIKIQISLSPRMTEFWASFTRLRRGPGIPVHLRNASSTSACCGLVWGAYHFGTGADGVEQADFFLQKVQPGPGVLLVLDLEANPQGPSMSLDEARAFVTHIQSTTGRWPGLYAGAYLKELLGVHHDPILGNCWFWLSQYGPTAVVPPNWKSWTIWQYTDGAAGLQPHSVAGPGTCNRD